MYHSQHTQQSQQQQLGPTYAPSVLKSLDRSAVKLAFCPSARPGTLLACGTLAGTFDDSFDSKSTLEIYDVNLGDSGSEMRLLGSTVIRDSFHSIAWGAKGIDPSPTGQEGAFRHGLVAGGMSDAVNIWNVDSIVSGKTEPLIARVEQHRGQVVALEFHPKQINLLASGASDGEVLIYDIMNPFKPVAFKPHTLSDTKSGGGISCVSWNRKQPHIISSASDSGLITLWDVRQKRQALQFPTYSRCTGMSWNPDAHVEMAVSYASPLADVWDLRKAKDRRPLARLQGHLGNVTSIEWCPHDTDIVLTCADDGRSILWNAHSGQQLNEFASGITYDVHWSPIHPGVLSHCSDETKVTVQSVQHTGLRHVPKWLVRPCGVSFGFGGRMVNWGSVEEAPAGEAKGDAPAAAKTKPKPLVSVSQLVTEPQLLSLAENFQGVVERGDYAAFCEEKLRTAKTEEERTTWTFLRVLLERNNKNYLLKELGYEPPAPQTAEGEAPKEDAQPPAEQQRAAEPEPQADEVADDKFFDMLASDEGKETKAASTPGKAALAMVGNGIRQALSEQPPVDERETSDDAAIRRALIVGDFKTAVARAIAVGRMADALIFASCVPGKLWTDTRDLFFKQHKQPFIRNVMKSIVVQDVKDIVDRSDVRNWKETLAIVLTYTVEDQCRALTNMLAQRLERDIPHAATLCYMCAGNTEKSVEFWVGRQSQSKQPAGQSTTVALHYAIEKISVFAHASHTVGRPPSRAVTAKYSEYAGLLASQGQLGGALDYLQAALPKPTREDEESLILLDRIFRALPPIAGRTMAFPFQYTPIDADPYMQQAAAARQRMWQERAAQRESRLRGGPMSPGQGHHGSHMSGGHGAPGGAMFGSQGGHMGGHGMSSHGGHMSGGGQGGQGARDGFQGQRDQFGQPVRHDFGGASGHGASSGGHSGGFGHGGAPSGHGGHSGGSVSGLPSGVFSPGAGGMGLGASAPAPGPQWGARAAEPPSRPSGGGGMAPGPVSGPGIGLGPVAGTFVPPPAGRGPPPPTRPGAGSFGGAAGPSMGASGAASFPPPTAGAAGGFGAAPSGFGGGAPGGFGAPMGGASAGGAAAPPSYPPPSRGGMAGPSAGGMGMGGHGGHGGAAPHAGGFGGAPAAGGGMMAGGAPSGGMPMPTRPGPPPPIAVPGAMPTSVQPLGGAGGMGAPAGRPAPSLPATVPSFPAEGMHRGFEGGGMGGGMGAAPGGGFGGGAGGFPAAGGAGLGAPAAAPAVFTPKLATSSFAGPMPGASAAPFGSAPPGAGAGFGAGAGASSAPPAAAAPKVLSEEHKRFANILDTCLANIVNHPHTRPADKKKLEEIKGRLGELYNKFGTSELTSSAMSEIANMCGAIEQGNFDAATKHHSNIVNNDITGNGNWLTGVRSMLTHAKKLSGGR